MLYYAQTTQVRRKGDSLTTSQTDTDHVLSLEPTTILINPTAAPLIPAPTPPQGVHMVADVRRLGHGINNLLTPLLAAVSLLALDGDKTPDGAIAYREANEAITRIIDLVRSFMQANRVSLIDLSQLTTEVSFVFQRTLDSRHVLLHCEQRESPLIHASMAEISDALCNLISNATDAMPQGGRLTIRTYIDAPCGDEVGTRAVLEVTDTGMGMTPVQMRQAFVTPFTSKQHGHGIGLVSIASTMQAAKGRIKITSRLGYGTSIQLRFPTVPST